MLTENVEETIEEVARAIESEVEAQGNEDMLLHTLDVCLGHCTLLLSCQLIVTVDHVLVVWELGLLEFGGEKKAGAGQQVHLCGIETTVGNDSCEVPIHDIYSHEERVNFIPSS